MTSKGTTMHYRHYNDKPEAEITHAYGRDRVNRLKALGNAIVPQMAYQIMKAIVELDSGLRRNDI